MRIAVIGLGAMGLPMATNLVRAGFDVRGNDIRDDALSALSETGGVAADSARDAAHNADMIILMVVSSAQAEDLLFREGLAEALPSGAIVAMMYTQPPADAADLGRKLSEFGLRPLDAPVSGGAAGAVDATLAIMASGATDAFEAARPVFEAVGRHIFHLGEEPGLGSTAKLINQHLAGIHLAAAAEAMSAAEDAGLPLETVFDVITASAGNSWIWGDRGPRMMLAEPPVASAVDIIVKDLGIVLDHGRNARMAMPLAAAAHQMFLAASGAGHGKADDSQVIRAYRSLKGEKQ